MSPMDKNREGKLFASLRPSQVVETIKELYRRIQYTPSSRPSGPGQQSMKGGKPDRLRRPLSYKEAENRARLFCLKHESYALFRYSGKRTADRQWVSQECNTKSSQPAFQGFFAVLVEGNSRGYAVFTGAL